MVDVKIHPLDSIHDDLLKYAVIVTEYNHKWIFVKHKDRSTWEIPGGRRELNEEILDTASRELREETGALKYKLKPVCIYSVGRGSDYSYGLLCLSEVKEFADKLEFEISQRKSFDILPQKLTYPEIQTKLFQAILTYKSKE